MRNYIGESIVIKEKGYTDHLGSVLAEYFPALKPSDNVKLNDVTVLQERLINMALSDVEQNIIKQGPNIYFGAGKNMGNKIFTRDIAFAGVLSLNDLYPNEMIKSLKHTRNVRRESAFYVTHPDYVVEGINGDWHVINDEAHPDYPQEPITRRSDDVIWIWAASDWIKKNGNKEEDWKWLYYTGLYYFEHFYYPFFDKTDGLYFGQASFIDVHYTDQKATGYPLDWSISDCCKIKATSTNCIYKIAFDAMALAAKNLGFREDIRAWREKSQNIKRAIKQNLLLEDGSIAYFKDKNGHVPNRREALGTALAILCDVVTDRQAKIILDAYPTTINGTPLLLPIYDFNEDIKKYNVFYDGTYHNNTSWPFVENFFQLAREKVSGEDTKPLLFSLIARTCRDNSGFREVVNMISGLPFGSTHQLRNAAAFLNVCLRMKLIEAKKQS